MSGITCCQQLDTYPKARIEPLEKGEKYAQSSQSRYQNDVIGDIGSAGKNVLGCFQLKDQIEFKNEYDILYLQTCLKKLLRQLNW